MQFIFNKKRFFKYLLISLILMILIISTWVILYFQGFESDTFSLGVDFSPAQAQELGLDVKETYLAILDDLNVKKIRLSAQWDLIQAEKYEYDYTLLDWLLAEARDRNVEVILAVGRRTPRWPECHDPAWLENMPTEMINDQLFKYIKKTVERYKPFDNIVMWQVENEPLLNSFGTCPKADYSLLRKEVAFVKTLDARPILVTDSGELGLWLKASGAGDYFGTTMYRVVHNQFVGYIYYHLPPLFYKIKAKLIDRDLNTAIISELQAEPWAQYGLVNTSLKEQYKSMDAKRLKAHIEYARRTGFSQAYLWGAEWWYWLKQNQNDDSLWETAKTYLEKY